MFEKTVILSNYGKLKSFVNYSNTKDFEIRLTQAGKIADAKNINEIFALDLTKPAVLIAKTDSCAAFSYELKQKGFF